VDGYEHGNGERCGEWRVRGRRKPFGFLTSFDYEDSINKLLLIYTVKKIHMNQRHRDLYDIVMKISCLQVEELRDRISAEGRILAFRLACSNPSGTLHHSKANCGKPKKGHRFQKIEHISMLLHEF
jgi:hypothetical protein